MAPGSLRATECRMAVFYAGFPDTVPIRTVNRQCSSGYYDVGIAAGLESLTVDKLGRSRKINPKVDIFAQARDCLLPMGVTSENVAQRYGVTREEQDRAAIVDPKTGEERPVTISVDDGNASQVSDGAGAVLLMKRSLAMQKGLPVLDVFRSFAASGVDPAVMGVGPASAIPVAVKSAGLELYDIDLFEIIEAFASQYVYCCKKLELDPEKVNANGSAIALGHPLGATGACCVATLLNEMKRRGRDHRFGVISMCIGSGMGASAVFERGDSVDELCNARTV